MFDVDCKDRSLGISCPPPSFVEIPVIADVKQSLKPDGKYYYYLCTLLNRLIIVNILIIICSISL